MSRKTILTQRISRLQQKLKEAEERLFFADLDGSIGRPGSHRRKVYDYIKDNPGHTTSHIAAELRVNYITTVNRITELVSRGYIESMGKVRTKNNGQGGLCANKWKAVENATQN